MINIEFHIVEKYKNKSGKPKIIVPKKNVKLAVNRNKIKRQIKSILCSNKIKAGCIIYRDKNIHPDFTDLKRSIQHYIRIK